MFKRAKAPDKASKNERQAANVQKQQYEATLGISLPDGYDAAYVQAISQYIRKPYRYGGMDEKGFDCSGLVNRVYLDVFQLSIPRQSIQIYEQSKSIKASELKQGDLYFFKIDSKKVSHIGMHVVDDVFIHASTKSGVVLSRLSEPYYTKTFVGYGTYRR